MGIPYAQAREKSQGFSYDNCQTLRFRLLQSDQYRRQINYLRENHGRLDYPFDATKLAEPSGECGGLSEASERAEEAEFIRFEGGAQLVEE